MRQQVNVDGRPFSYLQSGTAANVLVLLHAFPMHAAMWRPQLDELSDSWRVVAPDLRGFAWSEQPGIKGHEPSIDDYAIDVVALLDKLNVSRAVVCGLSMGGYAAFALARMAPQRIAGLVLANTKAEADSAEGRRGREEMLGFIDREKNIDGDKAVLGIVEQMVPKLLSQKTRRERPEVEQFVREVAGTNNIFAIRDAVVRMLNRPDSTPILGNISCPTLVVASDNDAVMPLDGARDMQKKIPNSRLAVINDAGHLSNLEQPQQFNNAVRDFLAVSM